MTEQAASADKGVIDKDLLNILCCPDTKQEVVLADKGIIADLNARIEKKELHNQAGQPVTEHLDGGLLRVDRKVLYPIRDSIPVMLIDEGISVDGMV